MKWDEQRGGRLILIWSVFCKGTHRVSARHSGEMLMQSTADIFRKGELAGLISKHALTGLKGMFDQAVCKNSSERALVTLLILL